MFLVATSQQVARPQKQALYLMNKSAYLLIIIFLISLPVNAVDGIDDGNGWGTWKAPITDGACILQIDYIDETKEMLDGISFYFIQRHLKEQYPSEFSDTDFGKGSPSLVAYQYPWAILEKYPPEIESISFNNLKLAKIPTTRVALFALNDNATQDVLKTMDEYRSFDAHIKHTNNKEMLLKVRGYNYPVAKAMFDSCNREMSVPGNFEKTASTTKGVVPRHGIVPY